MELEVYGIIYKITNKLDNKVYIGQTTMDFEHRYSAVQWWRATKNPHLRNSILKYGSENFVVDKKFDVAFTKNQLDEKETYWIKFYKSTIRKFGYNLRTGGANGKNSPETIAKMIISNRKIASLKKGTHRTKEDLQTIKLGKLNAFLKRCPKDYIIDIQISLDNGISKQEICILKKISVWELNRMIDVYNINYITTSSMKGNFGEKHHHYGKHNTAESKQKVIDTFNLKFHERFDSEINRIDKMLKDKVSISEISRIYKCSRGTMRKVIKHYNLESYGFNVKKHNIA